MPLTRVIVAFLPMVITGAAGEAACVKAEACDLDARGVNMSVESVCPERKDGASNSLGSYTGRHEAFKTVGDTCVIADQNHTDVIEDNSWKTGYLVHTLLTLYPVLLGSFAALLSFCHTLLWPFAALLSLCRVLFAALLSLGSMLLKPGVGLFVSAQLSKQNQGRLCLLVVSWAALNYTSPSQWPLPGTGVQLMIGAAALLVDKLDVFKVRMRAVDTLNVVASAARMSCGDGSSILQRVGCFVLFAPYIATGEDDFFTIALQYGAGFAGSVSALHRSALTRPRSLLRILESSFVQELVHDRDIFDGAQTVMSRLTRLAEQYPEFKPSQDDNNEIVQGLQKALDACAGFLTSPVSGLLSGMMGGLGETFMKDLSKTLIRDAIRGVDSQLNDDEFVKTATASAREFAEDPDAAMTRLMQRMMMPGGLPMAGQPMGGHPMGMFGGLGGFGGVPGSNTQRPGSQTRPAPFAGQAFGLQGAAALGPEPSVPPAFLGHGMRL